ncbi:hypothetical protein B0181_09480 [Moraxella caviae]|uniref:Uncharacterized protein with an alpha/beta hydrolase fold n=1 Tax=Moraxella caviae TaxID=34060 RepID=A0A1S9ZWT0_9GAMM|nr:alpha/beta fold hydrolase [Moraxella caviae]OOR87857.1 hypothetical protein B0181_09480 [Moraxella caviae]STZ14891.1 Uncharacterized protein with an alpha/beta hydrolase fold [Moraxella caviae]VEW11200.1 Uncharacterized protein with an alpha/beta hydrolase fold [Moraxella caviae]
MTSTQNQAQPLTILVHGLHQNDWIMRPLAKRLGKFGFRTHCHRYRSLAEPISTHAATLHAWLTQHHTPKHPINLVGHSLGGLVMRQFAHDYPQWQIHRAVTLGTPHAGSVCARLTRKILPPVIGKSYLGALDGNCPAWRDGVPLGIIAGNRPLGLGLPLLWLHHRTNQQTSSQQASNQQTAKQNSTAHDGTVLLSETTLDNAADYIILPITHTGILTDGQVAKQAAHFLIHGKFLR